MARTYSAAEQAEISNRYPGIKWVNGQPYTSQTNKSGEVVSYGPNGEPLDYMGNPITDTGESLVPAHTDEGGIPWWIPAAMIAAPAVAQGIGALPGLLGGGGSATGGVSAATGGSTSGGGAAAGMTLPIKAGGSAGIQKALGIGGGFMDTLGKIAPLAQNLGSVFGNAAKESSDTAGAKSLFDMNRYNTEQNAQMNLGRLDLDRQKQDLDSEGTRFKRAMLGQLLGNMQDVNVSVPGIKNATVTGGMRPSMLGQGGRDIAAMMRDRALGQIQSGNKYQGGNLVAPPQFSGGGNSFLNAAALAANIFGTPGMPWVPNKPQTGGVNG